MSAPRRTPVATADACVFRVAGLGPRPTLAQAAEAVAHPLTGVPAAELREIVAALAARVAALEAGADRAAQLAFVQISNIVHNWDRDHGVRPSG